MAQRQLAAAAMHNDANESLPVPHQYDQASVSSASHLDPAPKHPLHLAPSAVSIQVRRPSTTLRRRTQEDVSNIVLYNDEHYDAKAKDKHDPYKPSTLDKLEGWLGISPAEGSTSTSKTLRPDAARVSTESAARNRPSASRTTKLVVVHHVTPIDTLESIALRYKTDVRILRKANGLWPGDSVLVRKELYIPVEEGSAYHQSGISQADEGLDGKLRILNSQTNNTYSNGRTMNRPLSTASASSTSIASQSQSSNANGSWREVRRMATESLSHFPPPGPVTSTNGKEKAKDDEAFGYAEGLQPGWDVDHGESGVDDLLQLAEKARSRGSSPPGGTKASMPIQRERASPSGSPHSSSPSCSSRALEELWKPNKYTFGQKKAAKNTDSAASSSSLVKSSALHGDYDERGPAMMVSASYKGWNDIPEPPLRVSAKGKVAHAYKAPSKRRYPRPGAVDLVGPGTIIEDLATGLLPNAGPASKWARPIAESLPLPSNVSRDGRSGRASASTNLGWGQILSDTVRGKMALEEALERGLEDIRSLASSASASGTSSHLTTGTMRRAMLIQSDLRSSSSSRPSAEMARVTLAEGGNLQPGQTTTTSNGLEIRRSSGRSMLELDELTGSDADRGKVEVEAWSSTWSSPADGDDKSRRVRKNVDWLG